ncbi:MAG: hypothetical protein JSW70_00735 [Syntrophobacterales bacterium]|nr:MAG: hypothetical protein JSW70_00735 [Syntrophobacterales bacterium]
MIFPKGELIHKNLRTSYTNLNGLLLSLKSEDFSGYIKIGFLDYEAILFMDSGDIINAIEKIGDKKRFGQRAISNIVSKAKEQDGVINVYQLSPEMVTVLASTLKREILYKDLSTDFTSLQRLIDKLGEERHTGYIEIALKNAKRSGVIFFQDGEPIETILTTKDGNLISGTNLLNEILKGAQGAGAVFNVYRANLSSSSDQIPEIGEGGDLQDLLSVLQDTISTIETVFDGLLKKGIFSSELKRSLVKKSNEYPFLDPFAAEFRYKDGKIVFTGQTDIPELTRGLGECLGLTIEALSHQFSQENIMDQVEGELDQIKADFGKEIKKFNLEASMPEIFGSQLVRKR